MTQDVKETDVVHETSLPGLNFVRRGKVRDIYDLGEHFLIVATDRLSAFDVILPQPIPFKGKVLTQISNYWFGIMREVIPNHLVTSDIEQVSSSLRTYREQLIGRSIVVKKAKPLPVECIVRGYLSGSGWNEYRESGSVCGIRLPGGLIESSRLPEPIFTPSTKADVGHDENITFEQTVSMVGKEVAYKIREAALSIYRLSCQSEKSSDGIVFLS